MANYSMTPYAFWFTPRYSRGGERRPTNDVDAKGAVARDRIEAELKKLQGAKLIVSTDDETKSLRVTKFQSHADFIFVEFGVGRAGLVGNLHQRAGTLVPFDADEHNESYIRGIFAFPAGGHEFYWLSERAGLYSAVSYLDGPLVEGLRAISEDVTVHFSPVQEWSALKGWASQVLVQELRFDAPRPAGSTHAIDVNGIHADVRIIVKPRGSLALSALLKDDGPDKQAVFGFLADAPLVKQSRTTAKGVIAKGWEAQVAFKTKGGRQRSFGIATEDRAPTLVYPVGKTGQGVSKAYRPSDREFAEACAEFLDDADGRLPGLASLAKSILNLIQ